MEIEDIRDTVKEIENQIIDLYRDVNDLLDKIDNKNDKSDFALCAAINRLENRRVELEAGKEECDSLCDKLYDLYCNSNDLPVENKICVKGAIVECKILSSELSQEIDFVCDCLTNADEQLVDNIDYLIDEIIKVFTSCRMRFAAVERFYNSL